MAVLPKSVSRRDFINGVSVTILAQATGALSGCSRDAESSARVETEISAAQTDSPYPPALTGLRGSHEGSFEVAHELGWNGKSWPTPEMQTDGDYDLVIVGAGISGLSAAYFYRQRTNPDAKILILDNHDDFGGHAKRNEFEVDGKNLIAYGGSQSIDTPSSYSAAASKLLRDLSIDTDRFYQYYDRKFSETHGLSRGIYYDAKTYGVDKLGPNFLRGGQLEEEELRAIINEIPLAEEDREAAMKLFWNEDDHLPDQTPEQKVTYLASISYIDFLTQHANVPPTVSSILRRSILGLWGVEWDTLSALEATRYDMPATWGLGISDLLEEDEHDEPYIFHFPDGNASIPRMLVRDLIPGSIPGTSMEDIVKARVDYSILDQKNANIRLRLNSTAVSMRNVDGEDKVEIVYVKDGTAYKVRGRHGIMAGYMHMAPHICPELSDAQKEAIEYAVKTPLVYINVALRNWRPIKECGYAYLYAPNAFCNASRLDFPVSMGGYDFTKSPDDPTVLTLQHFPVVAGANQTMREKFLAGQHRLYRMTFDDFEREVVAQLTAMYGPYGFDAERDITAITVNRWPHGYAYEYHELHDPAEWNPKNGPHIEGRQSIGRISFANSDTEAKAYVNGAIDAAHRAVTEQLNV